MIHTLNLSYLCRDHVFVPGPSQLLERLSHLKFALSSSVDLGSVEEVDAIVPCRLHTVLDDGAFLSASVGQPTSQGQDRDLQAGWA